VGTAHRGRVDEINQIGNHAFIMDVNGFIHFAPVGGAHL
jgi:hypothetical protein